MIILKYCSKQCLNDYTKFTSKDNCFQNMLEIYYSSFSRESGIQDYYFKLSLKELLRQNSKK